jgi:hypothetical protein
MVATLDAKSEGDMRAAIRNNQARRNARQSLVARRLMLHGTVESN